MKSHLHKAIVSMHKSLADHHARCEKLLRSHADGCEDDDAHRAVFHELAHEHKAMSAHHHAAAAEIDASPEVNEFEPHSNGASEKATSAPFNRREFEKDCDKLPPELRKMLI
jgi:hypothetical protein